MYEILVEYIKNNKDKYNISYEETFDFLRELIDTIEKDFKNV